MDSLSSTSPKSLLSPSLSTPIQPLELLYPITDRAHTIHWESRRRELATRAKIKQEFVQRELGRFKEMYNRLHSDFPSATWKPCYTPVDREEQTYYFSIQNPQEGSPQTVTSTLLDQLENRNLADTFRELITQTQKEGQVWIGSLEADALFHEIIITPNPVWVLGIESKPFACGSSKVVTIAYDFFNKKHLFALQAFKMEMVPSAKEVSYSETILARFPNQEELNLRRLPQTVPYVIKNYISCRAVQFTQKRVEEEIVTSLSVTHFFLNEFCTGKSLLDSMPRSTFERTKTAIDLLAIFAQLHPTYVHTDLKPGNIGVITKETSPTTLMEIRLIDLESIRTLKEIRQLPHDKDLNFTTVEYNSPQAAAALYLREEFGILEDDLITIYRRHITPAHDLFSLGTTILEMSSNFKYLKEFFKIEDPAGNRSQCLLALGTFDERNLKKLSIEPPSISFILTQLLRQKPTDRISAKVLYETCRGILERAISPSLRALVAPMSPPPMIKRKVDSPLERAPKKAKKITEGPAYAHITS